VGDDHPFPWQGRKKAAAGKFFPIETVESPRRLYMVIFGLMRRQRFEAPPGLRVFAARCGRPALACTLRAKPAVKLSELSYWGQAN
jgi:hypothetical protein